MGSEESGPIEKNFLWLTVREEALRREIEDRINPKGRTGNRVQKVAKALRFYPRGVTLGSLREETGLDDLQLGKPLRRLRKANILTISSRGKDPVTIRLKNRFIKRRDLPGQKK